MFVPFDDVFRSEPFVLVLGDSVELEGYSDLFFIANRLASWSSLRSFHASLAN